MTPQSRNTLATQVRRFFRRRMTLLCVFHDAKHPVQTNVSLPFVLFIAGMWTILTVLAVVVATRNFDYWSAHVKTMLLRTKFEYVNHQISKSVEVLSRLQENDERIRRLLDMKSKKEIISNNDISDRGGPTLNQARFLQQLSTRPHDIKITDYDAYLAALRAQIADQERSYREIMAHITEQRSLYRFTPLIWPAQGNVTSPYGRRVHPITRQDDFHAAIDIAAPPGTPVQATADGVVRFSGWQSGYGQVIVVEHKYGYRTVYGHLSARRFNSGDRVTRGTVIGAIGNTGTSTGPHLHYEVWRDNKVQNPIRYVNPDAFFARR
jgi:murein DD-endopeptidase MepM/ murein hydrolase activator NlpD